MVTPTQLFTNTIYIRSDGSGKMMQIEVPRDQYKDALIAMQKRIDSGQVPNVSPGESAKNYVRKGFFTYEQSFNIAKEYYKADKASRFEYLYDNFRVRESVLNCEKFCLTYTIEMTLLKES